MAAVRGHPSAKLSASPIEGLRYEAFLYPLVLQFFEHISYCRCRPATIGVRRRAGEDVTNMDLSDVPSVGLIQLSEGSSIQMRSAWLSTVSSSLRPGTVDHDDKSR
jgi:hypothetical protein